jgi:hypothetical protein
LESQQCVLYLRAEVVLRARIDDDEVETALVPIV